MLWLCHWMIGLIDPLIVRLGVIVGWLDWLEVIVWCLVRHSAAALRIGIGVVAFLVLLMLGLVCIIHVVFLIFVMVIFVIHPKWVTTWKSTCTARVKPAIESLKKPAA